MTEPMKTPRTESGKVVSIKMDKTITVQVERMVAHPVYGKYIRRTGKLLAHDENNEAREGDVVVLMSCRPISKKKVWRLDRIVQRAK